MTDVDERAAKDAADVVVAAHGVASVHSIGVSDETPVAPYVTSNFAVQGVTESLRMELRSSPVRVSPVCPGATHTAMAHSSVLDARQRAALQQAADRTWGCPTEAVAHRIITTTLKGRPRTIVGPDSMAVDCLTRLMPGRYSSWVGPAVDKCVDGALGRPPSDRTEPTTHGGQ